MAEIGVWIPSQHAKQAYAKDCYDIRRNAGMLMIVDVLRRSGHEVEYCSSANANEYKVILVSITSGCDWWPYIRERRKWRGNPLVIVGGAGIMNIYPVLRWFNAAVFGRGEDIIVPLITAALKGDKYESESVCWSDEHSNDSQYVMRQAEHVYPHKLESARRTMAANESDGIQETQIGCKRRCLFCAYTHHRKRVATGMSYESGDPNEITMADLDLDKPESWPKLRTTAIDGASERLRLMVKKPIRRDRVQRLLTGLSRVAKPQQIKVYNIVGYPTEAVDDWREHLEDLEIADSQMRSTGKQWSVLLHNTPFRAMPATPAAIWPMSYQEYRGQWAKRLKSFEMPGGVYYQGKHLWAVEGMGCDSLSTTALDALILRGTEEDTDVIERIAASRRFWGADTKTKRATLEKYCDIDRLFGAYTWDTVPTGYLQTYCDVTKYGAELINGQEACKAG